MSGVLSVLVGDNAAAAGGSWTPASASGGLSFWFDATDNSTVLKTGLVPAGSTDSVVQWSDKSGNARDLTEATVGKQPKYKTSGSLNSLQGVAFDSVDDYLQSTSFSQAQSFMIVCVQKGVDVYYSIYCGSVGGSVRPLLQGDDGNSKILKMYNGTISSGAAPSSSGSAFYGVFNNTTSATRITGQSEVTGSIGTTNGISGGIFMGSSAGGNVEALGCDMNELFCMISPSGTDKTNALSYVATKWGLTW
jgi:hypothetical protein